MSVTVLLDVRVVVRAVNRLFCSPKVFIATTSAYGPSAVGRRLTRSPPLIRGARREGAPGVKLGGPKLAQARKVALEAIGAAADTWYAHRRVPN